MTVGIGVGCANRDEVVATRPFTLRLQFNGSEVFYHTNYDPPVQNSGGCLGSIHPDGTLHDLPYSRLIELGSGVHRVLLDENVHSSDGTGPPFESEDDRAVWVIRFCRFMENDGSDVAEAVSQFIRYVSRKNFERLVAELDTKHLCNLQEYAAQIPATKRDRDALGFGICRGGSGSWNVPDGTLELLRERFNM